MGPGGAGLGLEKKTCLLNSFMINLRLLGRYLDL